MKYKTVGVASRLQLFCIFRQKNSNIYAKMHKLDLGQFNFL